MLIYAIGIRFRYSTSKTEDKNNNLQEHSTKIDFPNIFKPTIKYAKDSIYRFP